jgi:hypothetical protein
MIGFFILAVGEKAQFGFYPYLFWCDKNSKNPVLS